jgi:hypothetical protein
LKEANPPGPASPPPADLSARSLKTVTLRTGVILFRIHRTARRPLHFGRRTEHDRRQRWDAPDASYGVCYLAKEEHIAFAETLLRDLSLRDVSEAALRVRSLARIRVLSPLRLAAMHGRSLRAHGADASVVQGPYANTWEWSRALQGHPTSPDGIQYRARYDDSGFSIALFERAEGKIEAVESIELLDPRMTRMLAEWLDRYDLGLSS